MIYVVEIANHKYVKIGFADKSVENRIAQLQTGNPFEINIVFTVDGTLRQEQEIHRALDKAMQRAGLPNPPNEWYIGNHPVMDTFLESLKFGVNQGLYMLDSKSPEAKQYGIKGVRELNHKWASFPKKNKYKPR